MRLDGPHPVDHRGEVVAAGMGVAGVEQNPTFSKPSAAEMASQSRLMRSSWRAMALSPPAVFSISTGT